MNNAFECPNVDTPGHHPSCCLDYIEAPAPRPRDLPLARTDVSFPARFAGHCRDCNTAIHSGELICKMSDDTYRHDRCGAR